MTTINVKEKEMLTRLMGHPLFETLLQGEDMKQVESLRSKLSKKKIDKKAVFDEFVFDDINGQRFTFRLGKGNGSLLVLAEKETFNHKDQFSFKWDTALLAKMIKAFYGILEFWGETLQFPYHKGYSDEFNVYEDEVERSISLSSSGISFMCYTGDKNDDNWTRIRPSRMRMFLKMMTGYLFLASDGEAYVSQLPSAIQELYPGWKRRLVEGDLETG